MSGFRAYAQHQRNAWYLEQNHTFLNGFRLFFLGTKIRFIKENKGPVAFNLSCLLQRLSHTLYWIKLLTWEQSLARNKT